MFPKSYDDLAVELIDHVADRLGADALEKSMVGKSLPAKLEPRKRKTNAA